MVEVASKELKDITVIMESIVKLLKSATCFLLVDCDAGRAFNAAASATELLEWLKDYDG